MDKPLRGGNQVRARGVIISTRCHPITAIEPRKKLIPLHKLLKSDKIFFIFPKVDTGYRYRKVISTISSQKHAKIDSGPTAQPGFKRWAE